MRLHIYNPDTDFALALAEESSEAARPYTPPLDIRRMRRTMALLPALFAERGDAILILDDKLEPAELDPDSQQALLLRLAEKKIVEDEIKILQLRELPAFAAACQDLIPEPWGWNPTLRRQLLKAGIRAEAMPSEAQLADLRRLSHRRLTIPFNEHLADALSEIKSVDASVPKEIADEEAAFRFIERHPHGFLKAPWSSSGRGVMPVDSCPTKIVREWAVGTIRRQGSILAESGADRAIDFATEWETRNGIAHFLGFSLFETSGRARYKGNRLLSQDEIVSEILAATGLTGEQLMKVVAAQCEAICRLIAPNYSGPLGVDMLADSAGRIRPCIEVNLRQTMGHLFLKINRINKN